MPLDWGFSSLACIEYRIVDAIVDSVNVKWPIYGYN